MYELLGVAFCDIKKRGVGGPEVNVTMKIVWMRPLNSMHHVNNNSHCESQNRCSRSLVLPTGSLQTLGNFFLNWSDSLLTVSD